MKKLIPLCLLATLAAACADSGSTAALDGPPSTGTRGVVQGGAQDSAHFRSVVAMGGVPSADTLDATGFFAEHALDLPPAQCGYAVCANPMLAVAPRFDNGNWTMAFVSLATATDPSSRPRPPLHLVLVLEQREALYTLLGNTAINTFREAFRTLQPTDRVSIISMSDHAEVRARAVEPSVAADALVAERTSSDDVGLYEGIATAATVIQDANFTGQSRVFLVTSGHATAGVTSPSRIVALGESLVRRGVAFSVVGVGGDFRNEIPRSLSELGAGTYAYAQSRTDFVDILRAETETNLFPLATGYRLEVRPAPGYRVGRIYGARRARVENGIAVLESPALFVGSRMGSRDVAGGRRGGGGGMFVELLADATVGAQRGRGQRAFEVRSSYHDVDGNRDVVDSGEVLNPLAAGENPESMWPVFSDATRGKVFVMLNMYLALRGVSQFYEVGDCARATGLINMMQRANDTWLRRYPDPDLSADDALLQRLGDNLDNRCRAQTPVEPTNFSGGCFGI